MQLVFPSKLCKVRLTMGSVPKPCYLLKIGSVLAKSVACLVASTEEICTLKVNATVTDDGTSRHCSLDWELPGFGGKEELARVCS